MASGRRTWPHALAALGAAGLLVSLWLPWYSFTIPPSFIDQAEGVAGQFGVLAPLITQGAELARHLGELHVSGWRVLNQIDIVLALLAGIAGGAALASITARASGAGRLIAGAGTVALVLCAYRTIIPPGPAGLLHADSGVYVALACSVAVLAGGLLASGDTGVARASTRTGGGDSADTMWASASAVAPSASSVAPPGM
jgi:hypothetical protein